MDKEDNLKYLKAQIGNLQKYGTVFKPAKNKSNQT